MPQVRNLSEPLTYPHIHSGDTLFKQTMDSLSLWRLPSLLRMIL